MLSVVDHQLHVDAVPFSDQGARPGLGPVPTTRVATGPGSVRRHLPRQENVDRMLRFTFRLGARKTMAKTSYRKCS